MKNYLYIAFIPFLISPIIAFIPFLISPIATAAEDPINTTVDVNVVNMPPVVLEPVSAHYLESEVFSIKAKPYYNGDEFVVFTGSNFVLQNINFVPLSSPQSGSCRVNIKINDSLVKIMQWQGLDSIIKKKKLNKGAIIAGIWEPPGGIVFTPNDILTVGLVAFASDKEKDAVCAADFVALAQMF